MRDTSRGKMTVSSLRGRNSRWARAVSTGVVAVAGVTARRALGTCPVGDHTRRSSTDRALEPAAANFSATSLGFMGRTDAGASPAGYPDR